MSKNEFQMKFHVEVYKRQQAERERDQLKKQLALYRNMSSYPRDDNYCGHHFVDNRCTICGKVVTQNIFDAIGG